MALCGYLKQSTAATITLGPFQDSTDGNTDETALTLSQADIRLSKNDGAFAQKNESTSASHKEIGYYSCNLNTTDTNTAGILTVAVHETGALSVRQDYLVLPANIYDSWFASDYQQVDVVQVSGATEQLTGFAKGVAVTKFMVYMELTAGGAATGKTLTVQVAKDGAAFATIADSATEISGGWYEFDLSGTEMNANFVAIKITATATNQRNILIKTTD